MLPSNNTVLINNMLNNKLMIPNDNTVPVPILNLIINTNTNYITILTPQINILVIMESLFLMLRL